jgi:hypothetical protein
MRLRLPALVLLCSGAAVVWACSLNPQPFPPDNYDASADATMSTGPDGAGGVPDGSTEDAVVPQSDASTTDASVDAADASDASDADATDDASDARDDADDGATE